MNSRTATFFATCLAATTLAAQQGDRRPIYREYSSVERMRVVCSSEHFGRVVDLVVQVPSGRIARAVVAMAFADEVRTVVVPFDEMAFDTESNLWNLGACRHEDNPHEVFDAAEIRLRQRPASDEDQGGIEGEILASQLMTHAVRLTDGKTVAHGLEIELVSGHVGFVDVASASGRAGDQELHPVPWSAVRWHADIADADAVLRPTLMLARDRAFLAAAPNLIEIIVQDPLYRARAYAVFGVPAPDYDTPR